MRSKKTVNLISLGCAKNRVDSEHLLGALRPKYIVRFDSDKISDIIIINTCGFILDAKEESIETILNAIKLKQLGKVEKVYVFGCLVERYADELRAEIPEVDEYFGVNNLQEIVEELESDTKIGVKRKISTPKHYAYLKIAEGCNWMCGYCAIPLIRGRFKSVPIESLVEETKYLVKHGTRELILVAQDITYYGYDLYGKRSLACLITELSKIDGIEWIRLHYGYPADFPMDVMDVMASNPKVCHYLDLPFQHISSNVLSAMRRKVTKEDTYRLIDELRKKVPDLALRTTLLVGYPGETEEDIVELEEFVKHYRFDKLGVFAYSAEEGTYSAVKLEDNVSDQEKERRVNRIFSLQMKISAENLQKYVGLQTKVIIDEFDGSFYVGRTQWDSPEVDGVVYVSSPEPLDIGWIYDCRIIESTEYDLYAEIL